MELKNSYLSGNNPWDLEDDKSFTIEIRTATKNEDGTWDIADFIPGENTAHIFPEDIGTQMEDLVKILLVFDFYDMCRCVERGKLFSNVDINDCDNIEFYVDTATVALRTVRYFGSRRVQEAIKTFERIDIDKSEEPVYMLQKTISKLKFASKFPIPKSDMRGIDIVTIESDTPLPKVKTIL